MLFHVKILSFSVEMFTNYSEICPTSNFWVGVLFQEAYYSICSVIYSLFHFNIVVRPDGAIGSNHAWYLRQRSWVKTPPCANICVINTCFFFSAWLLCIFLIFYNNLYAHWIRAFSVIFNIFKIYNIKNFTPRFLLFFIYLNFY